MTPGIAFTVGSTFAGSAGVLVAQAANDGASAATGVNVGIWTVGAAVVGWLVKRERDDRIDDRNTRRLDDDRTQARLVALEEALAAETAHGRSLYERMLRLAHKVHPDTEVAEVVD